MEQNTEYASDQFLAAVAAVWPDHTLEHVGQIVHQAGTTTELYTCMTCNALYWPDFIGATEGEVYPDRFVPMFDAAEAPAHCPCWRIEHTIKAAHIDRASQ